jgi:hypothetical protein
VSRDDQGRFPSRGFQQAVDGLVETIRHGVEPLPGFFARRGQAIRCRLPGLFRAAGRSRCCSPNNSLRAMWAASISSSRSNPASGPPHCRPRATTWARPGCRPIRRAGWSIRPPACTACATSTSPMARPFRRRLCQPDAHDRGPVVAAGRRACPAVALTPTPAHSLGPSCAAAFPPSL